MTEVSTLVEHHNQGKIRILAVAAQKRPSKIPDVPTMIESGVVPNYDVTTWYGLYGPKGMPPAVIAKLNKALNEILLEPETRDRLGKTGVIVKSSTPEAWHQFMTAEYKKWTAVREKSGLEQR